MAFNFAPYMAGGRNIVSFGAGAALTFGAISASQQGDIVAGFDHVFKGLNEIVVGIGILAPIATTLWSAYTGTRAHQVAVVKAASPGDLIEAVNQVDHPQLVAAVAKVSPATLVNAAAELEKATASQKVIS
jgi:hypothetical protein